MIFPIITFPYAARILGPEGTGTVNFAQSYCQYFVFFAALGIPIYGVREIAKTKDDLYLRSKIFFEINLIRVLATIVALIPYFVIVLSFSKFNNNLTLYYWGAMFIILNTTSLEWLFTGLEDFQYITTRSILSKIAAIIFLFIFVKTERDIVPYFLVTTLTVAFNGFFNIKFALNYISFERLNWQSLDLRKHLGPLFHIFGGIAAITIYVLLDTVILGLVSSDKAVGLYSTASKICKICVTIITALGTVLIPKLSYAVAQNDQKSIDELLKKSFVFVFTFGLPMSVGIFALAPELVIAFSGHEFLSAIPTIRILSPTIIVIGLANIFSLQILTPLGKDKYVMLASIAGAIVSVLTNIILIPLLDENGTAIANVVAQSVVTACTFYFAVKYLHLVIPMDVFIKSITASLPFIVIASVSRLLFTDVFIVLIISVSSSVMFFIAAQYFLFKNELIWGIVNNVKYLINKRLKKI
jgi:O-antigen/teichoic acid export membrane protein